MPLSSTEFGSLVDRLQKGDWKAVATTISDLLDRGVQQAGLLQDNITNLAALIADANQITYPTRTLDTDFVISPTRKAHVRYTVALSITGSVLGSSTNDAEVQLTVNGQVVPSAKNALAATLTLGLSLNPVLRQVISATIPAGAVVNLATTLLGGSSSAALVSSEEILI